MPACPNGVWKGVRMRERLRLDGDWEFRFERDETWRRIRVPGVWQAQFDDLHLRAGEATYERDVHVPDDWQGAGIWLCFGAVEWSCAVLVNAALVGKHEGGWLPFALDVTEAIRPGRVNRLTVHVADAAGDLFAETPHGKQSWYGPLAGIWQSVYLERRPRAFVVRAHVHAEPAQCAASISVQMCGEANIEATVISPDGCSTWVGRGETGEQLHIPIDDPEPWHPNTPRLYRLIVRAGDDVWEDEFGFRTVEARDGRVTLNGRPLYMLGALDQDYYPASIATPPSDDLLREQVIRARELGLNLLRCHIKVPDPRYLHWADRLGMLVWCELPSWTRLTATSRERLRQTIAGMVERDFNHPSLIVWTIANESWGLDLDVREEREWLADTFRWAKRLDPTRLWVDNSPCSPNFHIRSDLNDFHVYRAIPDQAAEWREWTAGWVADPGRSYSPHGDAVRTGAEPLIVSEFGNWGLPDPAHLLSEDGSEPWWFETGGDWAHGAVHPAGVRERFATWALDEVFGSWREFVRESQEHQFEALAYEIRDLRTHPEISGYVITEFTDVHWECNGLLDLTRAPKTFHQRFRSVNAQDVVVPRFERFRFHGGERISGDAIAVSGTGGNLAGCTVSVALDGRELFEQPPGGFELDLPAVADPRRMTVGLCLLDSWGRQLARDEVRLLVTPPPRPVDTGPVLIAERWDEALAAEIERGAPAVVFACSEDALPAEHPVSVRARAGTRWVGDWAQGMGWLRPVVRTGLALGPRVDLAFAGLTPRHVLHGLGPERREDVLGGLYLGWLRDIVATIAVVRHGAGAAVICTFPLAEHAPTDGLACMLLERLVEIARRSVT
jgi:Glycosyl hydrolases family 2, sugar binding domain/Glycosyl hydrolases family 2, TIM barrel domain/Glycosyl hydrolases family 2